MCPHLHKAEYTEVLYHGKNVLPIGRHTGPVRPGGDRRRRWRSDGRWRGRVSGGEGEWQTGASRELQRRRAGVDLGWLGRLGPRKQRRALPFRGSWALASPKSALRREPTLRHKYFTPTTDALFLLRSGRTRRRDDCSKRQPTSTRVPCHRTRGGPSRTRIKGSADCGSAARRGLPGRRHWQGGQVGQAGSADRGSPGARGSRARAAPEPCQHRRCR